MGLPKGTSIPLSPSRRMVGDLMHFSRKVPIVAIERRVPLAEIIEVRSRMAKRPSWFALFAKAYAIACSRTPELRQSYLTFPWDRLHQHACNVASLAIVRKVADEDAVIALKINEPEKMSLAEIDDRIHRGRTEPMENFGEFRQYLRMIRLPRILRRLMWWCGLNLSGDLRARYCGTFGVTAVSALGSASLHVLCPLTTTLTYGVFADDGSVMVRLFFDHRVMDGIVTAAALAELEKALHGPILEEMRTGIRLAA